MESCADLLLDHPGTIFIVTGFYIIAAEATETDGPPGAVAIGNALAKLGNDVVYVTDELSSEVVRTITEDEVIDFPITNHFESANFAKSTGRGTFPVGASSNRTRRTDRRWYLPEYAGH